MNVATFNYWQSVKAAAAHKHVNHDEAKSCTTYQNLVFDEAGSHTEPIIVCDTDLPTDCPKPTGHCYSDFTFAFLLVGIFFLGAIFGVFAGEAK